jgi:putative FmdB family regulatory protein
MEMTMPIYEYECPNCGARIEQLSPLPLRPAPHCLCLGDIPVPMCRIPTSAALRGTSPSR